MNLSKLSARNRLAVASFAGFLAVLVLAAFVVQGCGTTVSRPEAGDRGFKGLGAQGGGQEVSPGDASGQSGVQGSAPAQAPQDIPVPGDAQDLVTRTAHIQYDTSSTVSGVAAFYESGMADDGWSQSGSPSGFSNGTSLTFEKAGRSADVNIAEVTGNRTHVTISISGS